MDADGPLEVPPLDLAASHPGKQPGPDRSTIRSAKEPLIERDGAGIIPVTKFSALGFC